MGQHTRFYKDQDKYNTIQELYKKIESHDSGENWLHDYELRGIEETIETLENEIETNYSDVFRSNKKESDGSYSIDVIYSEEACYKWIEDNKDLVSFAYTIFDSLEDIEKYKKRAYEILKEFWNKYPNGCIDFG